MLVGFEPTERQLSHPFVSNTRHFHRKEVENHAKQVSGIVIPEALGGDLNPTQTIIPRTLTQSQPLKEALAPALYDLGVSTFHHECCFHERRDDAYE